MTPAYIPVELRRQVRADAGGRCGYCRTPEALIGMPFEYEHLYPEARGGATVRENLWLACTRCNDFKGDRTDAVDPQTGETAPLFNPRTQL
jgi:5-methylcytosine-specific restriction endonuclease McrA